ncbi:MAG: DUF4012 domain-containing protein [bacterium]|nr:DUF4012 domain-containing protein [bacterium]
MNKQYQHDDIPEANVLDLRARPSSAAAVEPKQKKARHVDFLSFVEDGEQAMTKKFHGFFHRAAPPESETPEPPVPPVKAATKMTPPSKNDQGFQYAFGPAARFALVALLVTGAVAGARFFGNVQKAKGEVLGTSAQALQQLVAAGSAAQGLQFGTSKDNLRAAHDAFVAAEAQLVGVAGVLKNIPGAGQVKRAQALLEAGQAITDAATKLATSAEVLTTPSTTTPLLAVVEQFRTSLGPAVADLDQAATLLRTVKADDLPVEYRQTFADIQGQLPSLQFQFDRLQHLGTFLSRFLGADGTSQRYLFTFQNTNELRPTGGFLGSLAIVDVVGGAITKVEVPSGGVYDISGQTTMRVVAPKPLQLIQANWNLQDANWFPDFATSARKVLQFYDSAGSSAVDGLVAMTPAVLQSFLQLTGPVEVPEVGETFTAENLTTKLQEVIKDAEQEDYSKPKLVMGYLTPKILARALALPQDQLWQLLGVMQQHLISRDIQFYFIDAAQQQLTSDLGWAGELRNSSKDFLAINRANLGGGKTDGVIEEVDSHDVTIAADGTITDTLTIIRKHNGVAHDKFTGDRNTVYVRAYVPQGSTFVNATGFEAIDVKRFKMPSPDRTPDPDVVRLEAGAVTDDTSGTRISTEAGHTVFGNWLSVSPGEVTKATITYTLPFTLKVGGLWAKSDTYSLLTQMQAGTRVGFSSTLHVPSTWQTTWQGSTSSVFVQEGDGYRMSAFLNRDQYYGLVFKKK